MSDDVGGPVRGDAAEPRDDRGGHDVLDLAADRSGTGEDGEGSTQPRQDGGPTEGDDVQAKAPPKMVFVAVGLVLLAGLGWGAYSHWRDYAASKTTAADTVERPVDVRTAAAKRQDRPVALSLPGQTDAFDMASIYPRATGYIGERRVDIGSRVKKGDLLVHIIAPDLDQQLAQAEAQIGQARAARVQAEAQVTQAEANVALAKVTFARTNILTSQGYETQQNRDNQQANLDAQQATIDRLKALTAFEDVRAPFDGVVTSRAVDTGDLLNADTMTATPMFTIARDDVIRVTVRVPQSDALSVTNGVAAEITVPQMPGRTFKGQVTRSSDALLYTSRTLTTEVDVPNPDGTLRPGLYVSVTLDLPRKEPDVSIPAEALLYNQNGMQVATVDGEQVRLHQVTIYRDHGTTVDLKEGLKGGERVVLEPPATLADGAKVKEHREEDDKKQDDRKPQGDGEQADASADAQAKK